MLLWFALLAHFVWKSCRSPSLWQIKVAPSGGPRFKEARNFGRLCQERRCMEPSCQPERRFGKCRERWKRVKVIFHFQFAASFVTEN
jgi:hypothetical protein